MKTWYPKPKKLKSKSATVTVEAGKAAKLDFSLGKSAESENFKLCSLSEPGMQPFKLRPADGARWFHANIKCQAACPVGTEAFAYVSALAEGDHESAYAIARRPNPFPFICGRVCATHASRPAGGAISTSRFRFAP